jgi:membrane-bound lytic murein transglycosylase D
VLASSPEAQRSIKLLNDGHAFDKMVEMNPAVQAAIQQWLTSQRGFLIDAWRTTVHALPDGARIRSAPACPRRCCSASWPRNPAARCTRSRAPAPPARCSSCPRPATASACTAMAAASTGASTRSRPRAPTRLHQRALRELNRNLEYTDRGLQRRRRPRAAPVPANGGASFWSPQVMAQLPPETRDYVPAVIAAAWLFLHPKKYGLDFPRIDTTPGSFTVRAPPRSTN